MFRRRRFPEEAWVWPGIWAVAEGDTWRALLVQRAWPDMFWFEYQVIALEPDSPLIDQDWWSAEVGFFADDVEVRNAWSDEHASWTFPGRRTEVAVTLGRVQMRSLQFSVMDEDLDHAERRRELRAMVERRVPPADLAWLLKQVRSVRR